MLTHARGRGLYAEGLGAPDNAHVSRLGNDSEQLSATGASRLLEAADREEAGKEVTGIGAAIAAGLTVGYWGDIDEVKSKIG